MIQFLSILLRNQFNLFYRFGYTFIPNSELIEFDGEVSEEVKVKLVKKFATTTPFEYDEEYLILHLDKESLNESDFIHFDIQNIVAVYPLSRQAKVSIESKIDQRIKLENPIFESILPYIEVKIQNKEVEKAIAALWTICGFEESLDKYLSEIGLETILIGLEHRRSGKNAAQIQSGSYWEYLISYDRYDYFPNTPLGFFYDAGQVFAYSKGHPSFEGSGIHNFLEKTNSYNPTIMFSEFERYFETEKTLKGYVSLNTVGEIKQYIIAPLYFMLREEIRDSDDLYQTKLFKHKDFLKEYGDSFKYVVIILGAFFGFRKFYDLYYNTLNLRFYKSYKSQSRITDKPQQGETGDTEQKGDDKPYQVETGDSEIEAVDEPQKVETGVPEKEIVDESQQIKTGDSEKEAVDEPINDIPKESQIKEEGLDQKPDEVTTTQETTTNVKVKRDEKENESDIIIQYKKIIREALNGHTEIRISEIVELVKKEIGKRVKGELVESVAKDMIDIEIIKIGRAKGIRNMGKIFER